MTSRPTLGARPRLHLGNAEVHVWSASLDEATRRLAALAPLLSADERRRAASYRFSWDRERFMVGRARLRILLAGYLGLDPAALAIQYGPHGKPALAWPYDASGLRFNVAHSEGRVVYAVARDREVGVDLERIRPVWEVDEMADRVFSPGERAVFRKLSAEQRLPAFLAGWTRKEAFVKAIGDGLRYPLDRFEVSLAPGEPARLVAVDGEPAAVDRWRLHAIAVGAHHVGALVVEGHDARVMCRIGLAGDGIER